MSALNVSVYANELLSARNTNKSVIAENLIAPKKEKILQRIARSENAAMNDCLNLYGDLVWSAAKKYTDSPKAAEDAAQDIFRDIWNYAVYFDETQNSEQNFILLIAAQHLKKCCESVF